LKPAILLNSTCKTTIRNNNSLALPFHPANYTGHDVSAQSN